MLTPILTKVLYVLGALALIVFTIMVLVKPPSDGEPQTGLGILVIIVGGVVAQLIWRVTCECVMVAFSIHKELVHQNKRK
jgi:xanthosine utilization system XapX-like protein